MGAILVTPTSPSDPSFGTPTAITKPADARDEYPRWPPDGGVIAYRRYSNSTALRELRVVDVAGMVAAAEDQHRVLLDQGTYLVTSPPSWTPDGRQVIAEAVPRRDGPDALHGITSVTIVGGTAAVSGAVEQAIRDLGVFVDRLAGANRYQTSAAVARDLIALGADPSRWWLATGHNWPDSLAAGPAAAHVGGVIALVDGRDPAGSLGVTELLAEYPALDARLVGGPDVITPAVAVTVERVG